MRIYPIQHVSSPSLSVKKLIKMLVTRAEAKYRRDDDQSCTPRPACIHRLFTFLNCAERTGFSPPQKVTYPNLTAGWLPRRLGGWLHSEHRLPSLQQVDAQTLGNRKQLLPVRGWRHLGGSVHRDAIRLCPHTAGFARGGRE